MAAVDAEANMNAMGVQYSNDRRKYRCFDKGLGFGEIVFYEIELLSTATFSFFWTGSVSLF
jgi:hypothetical protein